jgi:hypothetical protein
VISRFVVRPSSILTTPRLLAEYLGAETRRWPAQTNTKFDLSKDFFMAFPDPERINLSSPGRELYVKQRTFYLAHKAEQRREMMLAGIPVPRTYINKWEAAWANEPGKKFVVRPMRHREGRNYRITTDASDFVQGNEYVAEVFPKNKEYRVIFVLGEPLVFLYKHLPKPIPADMPWGYDQGAYFLTLREAERSPLARTGVLDRLIKFERVKNANIVAADIMVDTNTGYSTAAPRACVAELNTCPALNVPALSIERRLTTICEHIRKHRS